MALVLDTEKDDRLGALRVSIDEAKAARDQGLQVIALIGFPLDEGCRRNGGRPGAAGGPTVFRELLWKTGCVPNFVTRCDFHNVRIVDCGDIYIDEYDELDYDAARDALRQKVAQALKDGFIPFVIGGSNDQSYANACALLEHFPEAGLGVINLDAHLDVRPQKAGLEHSGSPFRQLLEDQRFFRMKDNLFTEFACQSHQCAASHVRWILDAQPGRACQTRVVWLDHMSTEPRSMAECFTAELDMLADADAGSFDVDSIAAAFCPGVSCPSPIGLDAQTALQCCLRAGMCKSVRLMDVSEFNPAVEGYNTGKLLVTMFYNFVMGVSMRPV